MQIKIDKILSYWFDCPLIAVLAHYLENELTDFDKILYAHQHLDLTKYCQD